MYFNDSAMVATWWDKTILPYSWSIIKSGPINLMAQLHCCILRMCIEAVTAKRQLRLICHLEISWHWDSLEDLERTNMSGHVAGANEPRVSIELSNYKTVFFYTIKACT